MSPVTLNYLAILVAALASMVIGFVWYSPVLFGKPWMKLMGWNEHTMKEKSSKAGPAYIMMLVSSLVMAYVLAHLVRFLDAKTWQDALMIAFWTWLGFIVTTGSSAVIWEGKPVNLFMINVFYSLADVAAMAVILTYWV